MKILSLVGARPQFVKEALVNQAARKLGAWEHVLVHSGQHYDAVMSDVFFEELGIPAPDYHLGIGSGTHGAMTAAALSAVERVLIDENPGALLVYGDTNTTLAGAIGAAKLHIPVIHVEAGIRQEPKTMPEEINRVLTDHVSSVLCCCSDLAVSNLAAENILSGVHMVGDVMYDLFLRMRTRFKPAEVCAAHGVEPGHFMVATLHRDFNVDDPESLRSILRGLSRLVADSGMPILLPLHPRTRKRMEEFDCAGDASALTLLPSMGYLELMSLVTFSAAVVTDSGGLQKEAYYAGRRALVIMPDTGWRELTNCGWNLLCPVDTDAVATLGLKILEPALQPGDLYGDGGAADHIVRIVAEAMALA